MHHPILDNIPLNDLNTLRLPSRARRYVEVHSAEQLVKLVRRGEFEGQRIVVLGGGSNVVLRGDVNGIVLHMRVQGRALAGEDHNSRIVRAGAGENWHDFVRWTLEHGWPGLENLSLIPGTVGAAPIQNVGAYGIELSERFFGLEAVDIKSGEVISFNADACRFGYRDSVFKQEAADRFIITSVSFRLPKIWQPDLSYTELANEINARGIQHPSAMDVSDAVVAIRSRKLPDPKVLGNAGSFFKNPIVEADRFASLSNDFPGIPHYPQSDGSVKIAAGWLIDQCGWRGRNLGPVGMYERQALVLVNRGGASGDDVIHLADSVRSSVRDKFGVELEQEPILV